MERNGLPANQSPPEGPMTHIMQVDTSSPCVVIVRGSGDAIVHFDTTSRVDPVGPVLRAVTVARLRALADLYEASDPVGT